MRTPYGVECRYFYGDYYRGRDHEECRLVEDGWTADLCRTCQVPVILRANRCGNMVLRGKVGRHFLGRRVKVDAYCTECGCTVKEPMVGCGRCHDSRDVAEPNGAPAKS